MGTSLTVHPFAMLAELVETDCPRVLINLERVGSFADRPDDVLLLGKCDEMVKALCRELGWLSELQDLWKATEDTVEVDEDEIDKKEKAKEGAKKTKQKRHQAKEEKKDTEKDDDKKIKDEVDALTEAVERSLAVSSKSDPASEGPGETKAGPEPKGDVLQIPPPKFLPREQTKEQTKEGEKSESTTKDEGKL